MTHPAVQRYPASVRWIHWLSAALLAVAYLTSESAEESTAGTNWHALAGLALLLLVLPRLMARWWGAMPPPVAGSGRATRWLAHATHVALLSFLVVQPLLGILMVWAEGDALAVPLTPWRLPPLVVPGEAWGERLEDLHETIGNVFYGVIALHVLASLWHQFIRRDGTLRRMW